MPADKALSEQYRIEPGLVIGTDDSRLLEELARFAERGTHDEARAALVFMGHVLRAAHRRQEQSG